MKIYIIIISVLILLSCSKNSVPEVTKSVENPEDVVGAVAVDSALLASLIGSVEISEIKEISGTGALGSGRTKASVDMGIGKGFRTFSMFYTEYIVENRKIGGSVTLEFTISPNDKIKRVTILESSLTDPAFAKIITKKIGHWTFGRVNKGPVKVVLVLDFK